MSTTIRPDLAAQPFKAPNFIAGTIFPPLTKSVKTGTLYYQDITADQSAQTDRTLATAPTAYAIASSSTTFTCAEKIHRAKVDGSEIEQLGGLANAQAKAARRGKRSVMKAIEDLAVTATFGNASITDRDILASLDNAVKLAKEVVQDYADGRLAVFGARRTIDIVKRYTEITGRMIYTGMIPAERAKDVRNITDDILAGALGVDVVLAGPSTEWLGNGSAYAGYLGVCVLPDPATEPDEEIQFGRTCIMDVDGSGGMFEVTSFYSDDLKSEVVDTRSWMNIVQFNLEACYILKGCDESNTVQTTAS
jgi:hypothetical protein